MGFCVCLCLVCITLCPFRFCNHLDEEERAGCFDFIVFRMSCYCVTVALPHGAVGWSAVCDCGIPDHTHSLFLFEDVNLDTINRN